MVQGLVICPRSSETRADRASQLEEGCLLMRSLLLAAQDWFHCLCVVGRGMCMCVHTYVVCVQMRGVYGVMCVFMFGCGCSVVCDGLCV